MNQQELKSLLHYDPLTGVFRWRNSPTNSVKPWDRAGNIDGQGYVQIKIGAKIQANGIRKSLGYYETAEQAHKAYIIAAGELHGQFARFQ